MNFLLRTDTTPTALTDSARKVFAGLNPTLPVSNVKTMENIIYESVAPFRFNMFLLGLFAAIAMALTLVGVYGVMNYAVTQRTQEFGIRMALGAHPMSVCGLVLQQGLILSFAGLLFGLAGSLGLMRLISGLLFGVSAADPITLIAVAAGLVITTLAACCIPAHKATRIDPIIALRRD
jgi:putative ABC transport system permease protein